MSEPEITALQRAAVIRKFNQLYDAVRWTMLATNPVNTLGPKEAHKSACKALRILEKLMGIQEDKDEVPR